MSRFLMKSGINQPIYISIAAEINTNLSINNTGVDKGSESMNAAPVYETKQINIKIPFHLFSLLSDFINFIERIIPRVTKNIDEYNAYNVAIPLYLISTIDSKG